MSDDLHNHPGSNGGSDGASGNGDGVESNSASVEEYLETIVQLIEERIDPDKKLEHELIRAANETVAKISYENSNLRNENQLLKDELSRARKGVIPAYKDENPFYHIIFNGSIKRLYNFIKGVYNILKNNNAFTREDVGAWFRLHGRELVEASSAEEKKENVDRPLKWNWDIAEIVLFHKYLGKIDHKLYKIGNKHHDWIKTRIDDATVPTPVGKDDNPIKRNSYATTLSTMSKDYDSKRVKNAIEAIVRLANEILQPDQPYQIHPPLHEG
ncbi:MAG: hypothetical protein ABEH38_09710 [Flavobacteriales bacterium]